MFDEIKTYLYGAVVAILIATGIWYTIHERNIGEQKIEARDVVINTQRTAIATAAELHTKDVQALAQSLSDRIGETFEKATAAPVVNAPHVLCYRPAAPAGGGLPQAAGSQFGAPGAAVERAEAPVDIGPAVTTVGKDDDAQINGLIDQIQVLIDAMNGKTK